jgi:general secretion pathway protein A
VQCFRSPLASLALIRQLDRPGLLTVYGDDAQPAYAQLVGLDDERATLQIGDARLSLPRLALAERWRGEFATLWRVPPGYVDGVVAGGASADWLAQRLAALRTPVAGAAAAEAPPLASQIEAFQRAQGLQPDGLAGPVTLMLLNRAAGVDEPRLLRDR